VNEAHTGVNLAKQARKVMESFGLLKKVRQFWIVAADVSDYPRTTVAWSRS